MHNAHVVSGYIYASYRLSMRACAGEIPIGVYRAILAQIDGCLKKEIWLGEMHNNTAQGEE